MYLHLKVKKCGENSPPLGGGSRPLGGMSRTAIGAFRKMSTILRIPLKKIGNFKETV